MRGIKGFIIIMCLLIPLSVFSQVNSNHFIGIVTDSSTSEPLTGANVMLKGTSIGTSTNLEGKFTIQKIQPGNYVLRISYIGYNTKCQ